MTDIPLILVSDVHGCFYTLTRLLNAAPKPCRLILLGDLVDRGPHSRKVVEFAMQNGIPTCAGNHEDLLLAFYHRKAHCAAMYDSGVWLDNGGDKAVREWSTIDQRDPHWRRDRNAGGRVPDTVLDWMEGLPAYLVPDAPTDEGGLKLLASHTGFGLAANDGDWFLALWGRHVLREGDFPEDGYYRPLGHTPVKQAQVTSRWAYIDTGAAYGSRGYGHLTGFLWPSKQLITEPFNEVPVAPRFTVSLGGCIS